MDSDFWSARLAAAKRQFMIQHNHHHHQTSYLDRVNVDDLEVEEEMRADFPCPHCYEDFDIGSLCSHLEDEHSCETKPTVCPVCCVKVNKDMLSHMSMQHGQLLKMQRRRRLRSRVGHVPNSQTLSLLGREAHHLQLLLGGGSSYRPSSAATDPFLSSLVINFPTAASSEELSKSNLDHKTPQHIYWKSAFDPSLSCEEREKRMTQATGRAVFLQDLLLSTLFSTD